VRARFASRSGALLLSCARPFSRPFPRRHPVAPPYTRPMGKKLILLAVLVLLVAFGIKKAKG
jgi:hypothetical protein